MKRFTSEKVVYRFSKDDPPIAHVAPGEIFSAATLDARSGQIKTVEDIHVYRRDPERANPVTGPFYVDGVEPGDTLAVEILDVQVAPSGAGTATGGVLARRLGKRDCVIFKIQDGSAEYNERIRIPLRPMVGTIGVAPAGKSIGSFYPGPHGGNMDLNFVRNGATVYLPVCVQGALLAFGDLHASMGDGELTGGGIDASGEVTLRTSFVKGKRRARPWIETPQSWITCSNAPTLEEAIEIATNDMVDMVSETVGIPWEHAYILIGACADARIGQAARCGIDVTLGLSFPKVALQ